jgi:toxin HigB-1
LEAWSIAGSFIARGDPSGLPAAHVEKIRNILSFIQEIDDAEELLVLPAWKAHRLSAARKGTWSLSVTRNWRITFRIGEAEGEMLDFDFEDYH